MGKVAAVLLTAALGAVGLASAADGDRLVAAGGVGVRAPEGWVRVAPSAADAAAEPRTALVVGTKGVGARPSQCQVAAYRIPAEGAAVVVLAWREGAVDLLPRDRRKLLAMRLKRPMFECWDGRGAVAQIVVRGRAYQVNVMVGDRASRDTIASALAIARSFAATA